MHESEKWKWSRSVVSDSSRPHGLQPTRLLRPCDFPGKSTGVGCHCLLQIHSILIERLGQRKRGHFLGESARKVWTFLTRVPLTVCTLNSMVFLLQTSNSSLTMRWRGDKSQEKGILQNTSPFPKILILGWGEANHRYFLKNPTPQVIPKCGRRWETHCLVNLLPTPLSFHNGLFAVLPIPQGHLYLFS